MGLSCSKKQLSDDAEAAGPVIRLSPFRPRRCLSRSRSLGAVEPAGPGPDPLLSLALHSLVHALPQQSAALLAALPPDLSQLLLEQLVTAGKLDDAAILALTGLGLHFYRLPLGAYPDTVRPAWLRCLATPSLEAADLSKTEGIDALLASMGPTPHLVALRLDYCVDLTDAGLALLQGLTTLRELSLTGCELLTGEGMERLVGLTRLVSLRVQTCHRVRLVALPLLVHLEQLDAGWCSSVEDADARVISRFTRLRELNLARTLVTDVGLAHLHSLVQLRSLNLAGLQASDGALAALLAQLLHLEKLNLERCTLAGDATLAALGAHATELRELMLGYTGVTDKGLAHLGGLQRLEALSLETCSVGDRGLTVLGRLTSLRRLDLSDTAATNAALGAVAALHRLECLNLSFTSVTDAGLKWLRRLTALRCLNLDCRHVTDVGLLCIAHLAGLECLDLFGARITDAGCATIGRLRNLRRLEVCGGAVGDLGAAHLAGLTRLQHLSLAQNYRLGNGAVPHLIKLNELQDLNLSQSRVTSNSVVALGCLPKLQALALYETRVKPIAVDKLLAANPDLVVQGVSPSRQ